jgi:hypothetical protein
MTELKINFPIEPLKENRFLIKIEGTKIHPYLFRKYKLFNDGEEMIFTTEFYETVHFSFNPKDIFDITGVSIEYLDPIGEVVNALEFQVKGVNFEREQSYNNDELQINKFRFIVNKDTMSLKYKPTEIEDGK